MNDSEAWEVVNSMAGGANVGPRFLSLARLVVDLGDRVHRLERQGLLSDAWHAITALRQDMHGLESTVSSITQGMADEEKGSRGLTVEERDAYRRTRARLFKPFEPDSQSSTRTPGISADMEQADGERERPTVAEGWADRNLDRYVSADMRIPAYDAQLEREELVKELDRALKAFGAASYAGSLCRRAAAALRSSAQKDGERSGGGPQRDELLWDRVVVLEGYVARMLEAAFHVARPLAAAPVQPSSAPVTPEERVERVEGWAWPWDDDWKFRKLCHERPFTDAVRATLLIHGENPRTPERANDGTRDAGHMAADRMEPVLGGDRADVAQEGKEADELICICGHGLDRHPHVEPYRCKDCSCSQWHNAALRSAQPAQPVAWTNEKELEYTRVHGAGYMWRAQDAYQTVGLYRSAPPALNELSTDGKLTVEAPAPSELDEDAVEKRDTRRPPPGWDHEGGPGVWDMLSLMEKAREWDDYDNARLSPAPTSQPTEEMRAMVADVLCRARVGAHFAVNAEANRLLSELFPAKGP